MNIALLIIDPQVDFTDPEIGALYVAGGDADMRRLGDFVIKNSEWIDRIFITMDTHTKLAIFHPMFWQDKDGNRPASFTQITVEDLESGTWKAFHTEMQDIAESYLRKLRDNQRYYPLTVWPEHCRLGTRGWDVNPDLMQALDLWEDSFARADYILKGTNPFTEMYSAIRADVIDEQDASTHPNLGLVEDLQKYDYIMVAGEALSHCVANTVRDLITYGVDPTKVVLLTDAMSNVTGFEALGEEFLAEMQALGMISATTAELQFSAPELLNP